jgi:hypothetical protein
VRRTRSGTGRRSPLAASGSAPSLARPAGTPGPGRASRPAPAARRPGRPSAAACLPAAAPPAVPPQAPVAGRPRGDRRPANRLVSAANGLVLGAPPGTALW